MSYFWLTVPAIVLVAIVLGLIAKRARKARRGRNTTPAGNPATQAVPLWKRPWGMLYFDNKFLGMKPETTKWLRDTFLWPTLSTLLVIISIVVILSYATGYKMWSIITIDGVFAGILAAIFFAFLLKKKRVGAFLTIILFTWAVAAIFAQRQHLVGASAAVAEVKKNWTDIEPDSVKAERLQRELAEARAAALRPAVVVQSPTSTVVERPGIVMPARYGGPDNKGIYVVIPPGKCSPIFDVVGERERGTDGNYTTGHYTHQELTTNQGEPVKYTFRTELLRGHVTALVDGKQDGDKDHVHPFNGTTANGNKKQYVNNTTDEAEILVYWIRADLVQKKK